MELNQFKIHVLPLREKLAGYAIKLMEDSSDAEDAVQEVMLKLWNIRGKLDEYQSVEALAVKMTHNLCMDMWRRKRPNTTLEHVSVMSETSIPDQILEEKDAITLMRSIIESLPPLQQTIIRMKDIEEYETEEIAEITGCSAEAIRSNLSRARKKVRDIYLKIVQEKSRRKQG